MGLNLTSKKAVVSEVNDIASNAHALVATEYHGLSVLQMTDLHARARETGVYLRVVKNTLAKRALADTEFSVVADQLVGPLVLAFSQEDPGSAARLWRDFLKENDKVDKAIVKFLSVSGEVMPGSELDRLAKLPTKDEAIALLMACMRAPLDKFARTLNEVPGKLVRTVEAVRQSKEAA
ncbi:50S ribosomal protein L10 [Suttonella sp. R2A3]|uniref:50S ribosomal protein L10 n=1 Tax=Suttonella sp. R2A3 TaxID=2908648 RepID=UPI001F1EE4F0|nr:50S ribosomal protein L10 [Suttonella sp. R2A3]UJF23764.1 50S ribosomal protein L10 [Suttonella sp. R2A3]